MSTTTAAAPSPDRTEPSTFTSTDPATGRVVGEYPGTTESEVDAAIDAAVDRQRVWSSTSFDDRAPRLRAAAVLLRDRREQLAVLMADEMGKPVRDGRAEVDKCAWVCEYYADHAASMLDDIDRASDHRSAATVFRPLGVILAVMPWNFPLWQVFRFAAPTLMAGNTVLLKHASNVSGSALEIDRVFGDAGLADGGFRTLLLPSEQIADLVADDRIAGVSLTGSEGAGRAVAEAAGRALKPAVLELGGSDAYLVLADADLDRAVEACASSRLTNSGQSCIAAKRFIVDTRVHDEFVERFVARLDEAVVGHPRDEITDVGPQARADLRDELHDQVERSVASGATCVLGGERPDQDGAWYPVTALVGVEPGMAAFDEEVFGPVAAVVRADDTDHAVALANRSRFGLGGAVFTSDDDTGWRIAADDLRTGGVVVNDMLASDPRLPFGGIGVSGYGRELAEMGARAFTNAKTVALR